MADAVFATAYPTDRLVIVDGRRRDVVDRIQEEWHRERPDVPTGTIGIIGRLERIGRYIDRARHQEHARMGADPATLGMLSALRRSGPPYRLTAGELSRASLVTTGAISQRLDKVEKAGLVRRVSEPPDRRIVYVELTDAGYRLVDALIIDAMRYEEQLLAPLGADDRRTLARILRSWLVALEHAEETGHLASAPAVADRQAG